MDISVLNDVVNLSVYEYEKNKENLRRQEAINKKPNETISKLKTKTASFRRTNRYLVTLPFGHNKNLILDNILISSSSLPGRSYGDITITDFGKDYKIAGDPIYNDWTITIITSNFEDYKNMIDWYQAILNLNTQNRMKFNEYQSTANVVQLASDKSYQNDITFKLEHVYPKSVSDIQLSRDSDNELIKYNVTFNVNKITFVGEN